MKYITRIWLLLALLLPAVAGGVEQFTYRVTGKKPQDSSLYIQGLQIVDGQLYVSTGALYGPSRLLRYNFKDGTLDLQRPMHPQAYGEGLTVMGDTVYQLTWKNRAMLVYDRSDLKPRAVIPLPGEGWGLTDNGAQLIYSDGSDQLHFMNPANGHISHSVRVTEHGQPVARINELEWIDGKVWANVWFQDRIIVIDPDSGAVTASIDLAGLRPEETLEFRQDVLNGIARNPADGSIWVTGKRWPWLFQIEPIPLDEPAVPTTGADSR